LGLSVIGTLGILLAAKRKGLLNAIRPHLDDLLSTNFFIGPELYERLLLVAGE
jgi:predicted nucleic acid-binding protein